MDREGVGVIYEMRTYQVQPGKAGEFLKMYQAQGLPLISRYAQLVGCWTKESGVLNSVVFIWAYDDLGHRDGAARQDGAGHRVGRLRAVHAALPGAPGKRVPCAGRLLAAEVAGPLPIRENHGKPNFPMIVT